MIFTNYRYNSNQDQDEDRELIREENKKKSKIGRILKWTVYSVCIFIFTAVIFRLITTGAPGELQNFIVKSESVQKAYSEFKDDLKIFKIDIRVPFAVGDSLFVNNVYYIEKAENLQLTLRLKNSRFQDLTGDAPFKAILTVFTAEEEDEDGVIYGTTTVIMEPSGSQSFGKIADNYRYFVYSFDEVKIDYANTRIDMYIFYADDENFPNEDSALTRYTVFDSMTPKSKMQAKKFKLG